MAGFSLGNPGQINAMQNFSGSYTVNAALNLKSVVNPAVSPTKKTKKKKKKSEKNQDSKISGEKLKKAARQLFEEENGDTGASPRAEEAEVLQENGQNNVNRKMAGRQAASPGTASQESFEITGVRELQKAVLWAEILGGPVSKKRRRERMERYSGQAGRRS